MSCTSLIVNLQSKVCLYVEELLAQSRCHIWSLSGSNGIQSHNRLVLKGTFKKYICSRFLSFDPPLPPCLPFFIFKPACPNLHSFWLELTLCPSIYILVKLRERDINNESSYLWLNSLCLLRSHSGISINWAPFVHGKSVCFIEMSAL